ncbi:MAG: ABC transporter permease [Actinomycetota bacterium]|nr:ABC transporter permease [Actinomycetota bacterium]
MSEWRLVRIAIWREVYSRRKAFLITTALAVVIVVGGLLLASIATADDGPPHLAIGVVDQSGVEIEQAMVERMDPEATLGVEVFELEEGKDALRSGSLDALIVGYHEVFWAEGTPGWMAEIVTSAMRGVNLIMAAGDLGLSQEDIDLLLAPISGQTIDFDERDESIAVVSVITVIVMFIAILAYGQWIAYGVVEEKANRVAELILGAITPGQLLTAKMLSLGGMGLAQMVIVGAAGLLVGSFLTDIEIPAVAGTTWVWLLAWFLIGYGFYGSLYAASGSLAADSQEAGSVITPLNILPGLGYVVGVIAFSAGAETLLRVLSLIPFWTPLLMPGRIAHGSVDGWEVALSIAMMVLATGLMVRFAARVYLGGITQTTRRVGWRQAFKGGTDLASSGT